MVLRFKSKEAYRKWNAYRNIHGVKTKHRQKVILHGKVHRVHHISDRLIRTHHKNPTIGTY